MNDERKLTDDDIMAMARDLPREIAPGRDLWPAIAGAIEADREHGANRPWPRLFAQAAAVLLLVGASSGITWLTMHETGGAPDTTTVNGALTFEPVSGSFGSQYTLGPDFQDARSNIAAKFELELERLPPATREEIENNLATIRAAIAEINRALAEQPDNVLLQKLLLSSYNEELAIMRKVDGVSSSVTRRTDI